LFKENPAGRVKKETIMACSGAGDHSDLPPWVVAVLAEIEDATPMPAVVARNQRAAVLCSLARTMARANAGAATILAALRVENQIRCQPPLNDEILEGIACDVVGGLVT
jgi:hypothetical protein